MERPPDGEKRGPGRPRSPEPKSSVSAWIPARQHDTLASIAKQHGTSVSKVVGRLLTTAMRTPS